MTDRADLEARIAELELDLRVERYLVLKYKTLYQHYEAKALWPNCDDSERFARQQAKVEAARADLRSVTS